MLDVPPQTDLPYPISRVMSEYTEQHHESEHDPTLASCCQRDLAQQAQDRKHLQRLQAADRSTVRADMTAAVLATPNHSDHNASSEASSDLSAENEAGDTHDLICGNRGDLSRLSQMTDTFCRPAAL